MLIQYSLTDLLFYLLLYSFLGWAVGVACIAIKDRKYVNRGLLNLPLSISEGITAAALMLVLPTLDHSPVRQFFMTWVIVYSIDEITHQFMRGISRRSAMSLDKDHMLSRTGKLILRTVEAAAYLIGYLLLHPFVYLFVSWLPDLLVTVSVTVLLALAAVDFAGMIRVLRDGGASPRMHDQAQKIGDRITRRIWDRLERAYPGVQRLEPENRDRYTFARGICFDKLVWVFLVSSFLGALIEMVYCRVTGGSWMNRSSVLYGAFSIVWGLGAVVLTVVLQRLAEKPDRHIFLAGFLVGGAYEYLCSVFTELVFGTVFWDYSEMPLNIGGRTNVLYCVFWGILAVVWLRVLYPPMERGIEKIPPLIGKILTWALLIAMVFNGLLTAAAMMRYTQRQTQPEPDNIVEEFLDTRYDDAWMERRWPNMVITLEQ